MDDYINNIMINLEIAINNNLLDIKSYSYMTTHIIIYYYNDKPDIFTLLFYDEKIKSFDKKINRIIKLNKIENE